jgi:outer membrane protein
MPPLRFLRCLGFLVAATLLGGGFPAHAQQQQQQNEMEAPPPPLGETGHAALPDTSEAITYEDAIRMALERNYRLRQARNDVATRSISVDQNRAEYYPSLNVSVGGSRDFGRNFSQSEGGIISQTSNSANFGASSNLLLFDGFRRDATLDQAQARTEAAGNTLRRTRQDVVYQVLERYIGLAQNRALVEVRQEQLQLRQDQLDQTRAQIEVGERAPSAIYQLQADVASARQQLVQARRDARISKTELVRLLVLDPFGGYTFATEGLRSRLDTSGTGAQAPRPYRLEDLLATAYQERPDLRAQRASINAEEQSVRAARASWWPSLRLSASYGSSYYSLSQRPIEGTGTPPETVQITPEGGGAPVEIPVPGTGQQPDFERTSFFDQLDARRGGSISLSFSYPLFDRFQRSYEIEQAQVQLESTRFQKELLRQNIAVEARQALVSYRDARTSLEVAREQLEAARQAQEAAQQRYRLGAATYVELAEANAALADARTALVNAQFDLLLQRENIDYITGTLDPESPLAP